MLLSAERAYHTAEGNETAQAFTTYVTLLAYYSADSSIELLQQALYRGSGRAGAYAGKFYLLLGRANFMKGDHITAAAFYDSSRILLGSSPSAMELAAVYSEAAYNLAYQSRFDTALALSYKAAELARGAGRQAPLALNTICIINYILRNMKKANIYCDEALAAALAEKDEFETARAYGHRGIIDLLEDRFTDARAATNKAVVLWTRFGYRKGVAGLYENLAMIERFSGNNNAALQNHFAALAIRTELNDRSGIASSRSNIGALYLGRKRYAEALPSLLAARALRKELGDLRGLATVTELLSRCYEGLGDYQQALSAFKESKTYSDSIFSAGKARYQQELEARYEAGARDYRIKLLQQENTNKEVTISVFILITVLGIMIAALLAAAFYFKRKTAAGLAAQNQQILQQRNELAALNLQLQKANTEKDKLFNIISHDLKSPFQVLLAYPEIIRMEANERGMPGLLNSVSAMETAGRQIYRLVENLLNWSRLSLGKLEVIKKPVAAEKIIYEALEDLSQLAELKQLGLFPMVAPGITVSTDAGALGIVLRNLLSNAIKFTPENGSITIEARQTATEAILSVADTGVGMTEEKAAALFSGLAASTQGTAGEQGTGLGMMICYELVKLLGGAISVKSRPEQGTTVTITLPLA